VHKNSFLLRRLNATHEIFFCGASTRPEKLFFGEESSFIHSEAIDITFYTNDERVHPYQRRRTSITGCGL
jgi:hypothetical protein